MAKDGPKRRVEENRKKLALYRNASVLAAGAHIVIRFVIRYQSVNFWACVSSALGLACILTAYRMLRSAAEASYSASGELIDAGADLSKSDSSTTLAKDVLWASVILLPLVSVTKYAWILVLASVGVGAWYAYQSMVAPMLNMQKGAAQSDTTARSRQDKAAKRAERRRVKYK